MAQNFTLFPELYFCVCCKIGSEIEVAINNADVR